MSSHTNNFRNGPISDTVLPNRKRKNKNLGREKNKREKQLVRLLDDLSLLGFRLLSVFTLFVRLETVQNHHIIGSAQFSGRPGGSP